MMADAIHAVLFATDLSSTAPPALSYAAWVASHCRARLFLVHVLDPSVGDSATDSSASELHNLAQSAKDELLRISRSLLAVHGITGEVLVRYGNVRDVIFQVQQEVSADMVVLGSSGKKTGHRSGLWSVAEAVLREMSCSVLTVGPNVKSVVTQIHKVLFPTDFF